MEMYLWLLFIFSAIGILDTLYLVYVKIKGKEVYCLFFPNEWCRKVQHSKYSSTLGIPNSVAGLVMYTFIFVLLFLFLKGIVSLTPIMSLVTFGFLFSLYFLFIQGYVLRAFCTWCVLSFINFSVMAYAVWFMA